jgi:hypothetical protein
MSSESDLQAIEARVAQATGDRWELGQDIDGNAVVRVRWDDGRSEVMRVTRDGSPADRGDVEFIANARGDLELLVAAVRGHRVLVGDEEREIARRLAQASPGPWRAFVGSDGGLGGCDVISVSDADDQPDLYIWLTEKLAPGDDFKLVAAARQDIPHLLEVVTAV